MDHTRAGSCNGLYSLAVHLRNWVLFFWVGGWWSERTSLIMLFKSSLQNTLPWGVRNLWVSAAETGGAGPSSTLCPQLHITKSSQISGSVSSNVASHKILCSLYQAHKDLPYRISTNIPDNASGILMERGSTPAKRASRKRLKFIRSWFKLHKRMKKMRIFGFVYKLWILIWFKGSWKTENRVREGLVIVLSLTPLYLRFCLQYLSSCHGDLLLAICTRLHNITNRDKKKQVWTKWKDIQMYWGREKCEADIKHSPSQPLFPPLLPQGKSNPPQPHYYKGVERIDRHCRNTCQN